MTSSPPVALRAIHRFAVTALFALSFVTWAPSAFAQRTSEVERELRPQLLSASIGVEFVTRRFDVRGPTDVEFDAPYYPGLMLRFEAYPVAWFAPDSPAGGVALWAETSKHATTTAVAIRVEGDPYDLSVPTRHDMSYFALAYAWTGSRRLQITPAIGWRTTEFSLSYNSYYGSSFYRGVELSLRATRLPGRIPIRLDGSIFGRPSLSLGSTATAFGDSAQARGAGGAVAATLVTKLGLTVGAETRVEWTRTRYESTRQDSTSNDLFQSFVISVGYAL
ncbi:MAG: hypothetical protein ACI81R_002127 [Bradymonadia bacterium]|jgi:hypothetical protein